MGYDRKISEFKGCGVIWELWIENRKFQEEGESKKDAKKVTDGAGDEEAGMGVAEKRRGSVVVEAGDADHACVLLPRGHALLLLLLTIIDIGLCIFHSPLFIS